MSKTSYTSPTFTDTGAVIDALVDLYGLRDSERRQSLQKLSAALKNVGDRELAGYLGEELRIPVDVAKRLLRALHRLQEEVSHIE